MSILLATPTVIFLEIYLKQQNIIVSNACSIFGLISVEYLLTWFYIVNICKILLFIESAKVITASLFY